MKGQGAGKICLVILECFFSYISLFNWAKENCLLYWGLPQGFQLKLKSPAGLTRVTDLIIIALLFWNFKALKCDFQRAGQTSVFFIQENVAFIQVSIYQPPNQIVQAINKWQ